MPLYEFYCPGCHTIYNFFSSAIDTSTTPPCPRCPERPLERKPASFAIRAGGLASGEEGDDDPWERLLGGNLDEERLEAVMASFGSELEAGGDPDDPRQLARVFRRFGDALGLEAGPRMEEMLARLEAGEDPDALEAELGDDLGSDGDLEDEAALAELFRLKKKAAGHRRKPRTDPEIYFL